MKKVFILFIVLIQATVHCSNLVSNGDFTELDERKLPSRWQLMSLDTNSGFSVVENAFEGKPALRVALPDFADKAMIKQVFAKTISVNSLVRVSCVYKTENLRKDYPLDPFLCLCSNDKANISRNNSRFYLNPSPKWRRAETVFTSSENYYGFRFSASRCEGNIYITDVKVEVIPHRRKFQASFDYVWKEAEDLKEETGLLPRMNNWNPDGTIVYSGKGAVAKYRKPIKWKFKAERKIDEETLLGTKTTYHVWLRLYGYLEEPLVTTRLYDDASRRTRLVEVVKTKGNEKKNDLGAYAGPGNFYWQYAGSFTTDGGVYELTIEPEGRVCLDGILLTSDVSYQPEDVAELAEMDGPCPLIDVESDEKVSINGYKTFGITDQFSAPISLTIYPQEGFDFTRKADSPAHVALALPPCVEITNYTSHWAGRDWKTSRSPEFISLKSGGKETIDGEEYDLHRVSMYRLHGSVKVFVKCVDGELEDGKRFPAYYWIEDGDMKTTLRKMMLEMVALSPVKKTFETIFIGPMGGWMRSFFRDYQELPDVLKYCGLNILNTWRAAATHRSGGVEITRKLARECNDRGIAVIDEISPFLQYKKLYLSDDAAMTIDGVRSGMPALHIDEDSPAMKAMREDIARIVKSGVSGLSLDDEIYNRAGDDVDFSEKTKELFKTYLAEHANLEYVDPVEIVKNKDRLHALYSAWVDFKCARVLGWYDLYRATYENALKETGADSTFGKQYFIPVFGYLTSSRKYKQRMYFDIPELAKRATQLSPMIYTYRGIREAGRVGATIKNLWRMAETEKNIVTPTLLGGHGGGSGEIPRSEMKMVKYEIYECLINQSPGMFFWLTPCFINPLALREVVTAVNATAEREEFFTKGVKEKVSIKPVGLNADALRLGDDIVVYASNYQLDDKIHGTVSLQGGAIVKITDLETGETLPASGGSFVVDFSRERGRLFLVECNPNP